MVRAQGPNPSDKPSNIVLKETNMNMSACDERLANTCCTIT
jgi:hypothetical protein